MTGLSRSLLPPHRKSRIDRLKRSHKNRKVPGGIAQKPQTKSEFPEIRPERVLKVVARHRGKTIYSSFPGSFGDFMQSWAKQGNPIDRRLVVTLRMKDGSTEQFRGNGVQQRTARPRIAYARAGAEPFGRVEQKSWRTLPLLRCRTDDTRRWEKEYSRDMWNLVEKAMNAGLVQQMDEGS